MSSQMLSPIAQRFEQLKQEKRLALMPFLMAGDPDLATTAEVLLSLQNSGADMVELGMPYSDPLADGPVIQAAAARALAAGTTPTKVLEMLTSLKGQLTIPVILFTYSNPLLNVGMEAFCERAAAAGAAGLVVPDLPLEGLNGCRLWRNNRDLIWFCLLHPQPPLIGWCELVNAAGVSLIW